MSQCVYYINIAYCCGLDFECPPKAPLVRVWSLILDLAGGGEVIRRLAWRKEVRLLCAHSFLSFVVSSNKAFYHLVLATGPNNHALNPMELFQSQTCLLKYLKNFVTVAGCWLTHVYIPNTSFQVFSSIHSYWSKPEELVFLPHPILFQLRNSRWL